MLECWSSVAERLFLALPEIVRTLVRRLSALRAHLSLLSSCDGDPHLSQPQRSSILLVCCAALFLAVLDRLTCSARMASRAWRAGTTENLQYLTCRSSKGSRERPPRPRNALTVEFGVFLAPIEPISRPSHSRHLDLRGPSRRRSRQGKPMQGQGRCTCDLAPVFPVFSYRLRHRHALELLYCHLCPPTGWRKRQACTPGLPRSQPIPYGLVRLDTCRHCARDLHCPSPTGQEIVGWQMVAVVASEPRTRDPPISSRS